jgi:hypothetical protein
MSENSLSGPTTTLLQQVLDAWVNRNERNAARKAGELTFWRDGMLEQLEAIANGKANDKTFSELKKNFKKSAEHVDRAIEKLKELRNEIGPNAIGKQIDEILNSNNFGKTWIRDEISMLLEAHKYGQANVEDAKLICQRIHRLNAELARLKRLVSG